MTRPNVAQMLWHSLGGKLPERYREWALHDATCRTWWLRYVVGLLLRLLIPLALLFALLKSFGGPLRLVSLSVVLGLLAALYYSLTYAPDNVDSRLIRYGYPPETASTMRKDRDARKTAEQRARYDAKWRTDQ